MRDGAPAYQDPVSHSDALCLVSLRGEDRTEKTLATENGRESLYAHLRTYTLSMQFFAAGEILQPTPSTLCELA